MLKLPAGSVGGGGVRDPVVFRVATTSHHHGLDACTVYDIFGSILKNNKTTEPMCTEVTLQRFEEF
jgi:hypothetical protein